METIDILLKEYISLDEQLKEIEKKKKEISKIITPLIKDKATIWDKNITKVATNRTWLRENVTITDIKIKFPDAIKEVVDMDYLKTNPDAFDLLEIKTSYSLRVSGWKKKEKEDEF